MQPGVMTITIPGNPIAKMRHRHFTRGGYISTYDPQQEDKKYTQAILKDYFKNDPLNTRLDVKIDIFLPVSESWSGVKRNHYLWGYGDTKKPDLDNVAKFYLDAGNGVLWADDSQITSLVLNKSYSIHPRTVIMIEEQTESLDEGAKEILGLISPDDFDEIFHLLNRYREIRKKSSEGHEQIWASWAAVVLSELADKYSIKFSTIKKKHPNYWQNSRFGERFPQC